MNDVKRLAENELKRCAEHFPVVTVLGPRQSGKTTLVKSYFKDYSYINLEDPEFCNLAKSDVNAFFGMIKGPVILDEVQRVPELLNKIQVITDEKKEKAQFVLTGSFQQGLKSAISQSLAGRTAIINLLPFSIQELNSVGTESTVWVDCKLDKSNPVSTVGVVSRAGKSVIVYPVSTAGVVSTNSWAVV